MREIIANPGVRMELGRAGESGVTSVRFDVVKEWQKEVGAGGTLRLLVQMEHQDTYPAAVTLQGGSAVWVVTAAETARSGDGQAQLSYLLKGKVAKSACYSYTILPSLSETAGAVPPEQVGPWYTHIEQVAQEAHSAAISAKDAAKKSAAAAKAEADRAQAAAQQLADKAQLSYVDQTFAPAIRETLVGATVSTDMVSPVEHQVQCRVCSENLVPFPFREQPGVYQGITFRYENGIVIATGTASAAIYLNLPPASFKMKAGTYSLSGCPKISGCLIQARYDGAWGKYDSGTGATFEVQKELTGVIIQINAGTVLTNAVFKPKLQFGTAITAYTPYVKDVAGIKVTQNPGGKVFVTERNGEITGMKSVSPSMSVEVTHPGVVLEVAYNMDTKQYIDTKVNTTKESATAPAGEIPSYVSDEAKRLANVVGEHQNENTFSMLFTSDIHARFGLKTGSIASEQMLESLIHAAQAADLVRRQVHLDYAANLGDTLWDGPENRSTNESPAQAMELYRLVHEVFSPAYGGLPQCWLRGNHDLLCEGGCTPGKLTAGQVWNVQGAWCTGERPAENRVAGYGYQDFPEAKLRIIYLNTSETANSYAVSQIQADWLNTALDLTSRNGWQSVLLSHVPLDMWGGSSAVMAVLKKAKNVLCNIHGHTHNYLVGVLTGTNIPRIAIPNVDFYRTNEYGKNDTAESKDGIEYGTPASWDKISGTKDDTAFCVITIDKATNKLYADHYGAGEDRVVELPKWIDPATPSYSNLVPTAEAFDSAQPYNGKGYADGKYLTWTPGSWEGTDPAMCVTGYIPYNPQTDVLYIKGAAWDETASHCRMYSFTSKNQAVGSSLEAPTPNADIGSMEKLGADSYKFTAGKAWAAAKINYIRISLKGKGADLLVSKTPIE